MSLHRLLAVVTLYLLGVTAVHLPFPAPALAQGSMLEISMEELVEDTWNNRVVARGNVEIRYYGEILLADEVAYDRSTRKLTAEGNVSLTESDGKVYRLTLKGSPRVSVYTTATSTGWPDLQSVGVQFPKLREGYAVSVTAFGPYPGMDEAFSPTGIATPFPSEMFSSQSLEPYVEVVAPGEPAVIPPAKQVDDDDEAPPRR